MAADEADDTRSARRHDTLVPSSRMEERRTDAAPPTMKQRKSSTEITVVPPPSPATSAAFEQPVAEMRAAVPGCVAAAVVDIGQRHLLAWQVDEAASRDIELIAGATADLYAGERVRAIEAAFRQARGLAQGEPRGMFREVVLMADDMHYVFLRAQEYPDLVALVVCTPETSLGMALSKSRTRWNQIQEALF